MSTDNPFYHFVQQLDFIGQSVLAILLCMSVGCWFFILRKAVEHACAHHHASHTWLSLHSGELDDRNVSMLRGDLAHLLQAGLLSFKQWQTSLQRGQGATVVGDPLERALAQQIGESTINHERGLTFLACVAAGAPFVGLFGTVMGIYHALAVIGTSGEAGLSQVAGPVGEALLMTACGLACAIPAVLAYNFFTRSNRLRLADMERFAHTLHSRLTLGLPAKEAA